MEILRRQGREGGLLWILLLELLKTTPPTKNHIIASVDVESLYIVLTKVPVDRTNTRSHVLLHRKGTCYQKNTTRYMEICTKEAPFTSPRGELYCQVDGVAMGSPLGVLFSNFFMGCIESTAIKKHRPFTYSRYIDVMFV